MAPICLSIGDQAFVGELRGINLPVTARFGPDGALYLVGFTWSTTARCATSVVPILTRCSRIRLTHLWR
jgi:hypothetical protein